MQTRLPGLVELDAGNPGPLTGAGNHTWLLTGAVPTLVDAGVGTPAHLDAIEAALETAGQTLHQVVVTHAHPDHASGSMAVAGALAERRLHEVAVAGGRRALPGAVDRRELTARS